MLALVGKSGAGKTTIEDYLIKNFGFRRAISHTTRQKRLTDIDGVNYYFVSEEEINRLFKNGELVERVEYSGNVYGYIKSECKNDRVVCVVPDGLRQINEHSDLDIFSIYLETSMEVRKNRMINRGDTLENVENRLKIDEEVFKGIENDVNVVLNNDNKTIEEIVKEIVDRYNNR